MSAEWLAFLGGILAVLVSGLIASIVQRNNETERKRSEARLNVYFQMLDLNQQYFWIASAEMHGEKPAPEATEKCRELSWKLADTLRKCDHVEHLEEILEILFSSAVPSARERADRLDKVLETYGELVNPSYSKVIQRISKENIRLLGSGEKINNPAPTSWRLGE